MSYTLKKRGSNKENAIIIDCEEPKTKIQKKEDISEISKALEEKLRNRLKDAVNMTLLEFKENISWETLKEIQDLISKLMTVRKEKEDKTLEELIGQHIKSNEFILFSYSYGYSDAMSKGVEFKECIICRDLYRIGTFAVTKCKHDVICKICYISIVKNSNDNKFHCPICRNIESVSSDSDSDEETDFHIEYRT